MNGKELTQDQIAQAHLYDKVNGPFPYVTNMDLVRKQIRRGETPPWFYMTRTQERKFYALVESLKTKAPVARKQEATSNTCGRGHAFTPENTYVYKGVRSCRACREIFRKSSLIRTRARDKRTAELRENRDRSSEIPCYDLPRLCQMCFAKRQQSGLHTCVLRNKAAILQPKTT